LERKAQYLFKLIKEHPNLFEIFAIQYTLVCFQVKDKEGKVSIELTKRIAEKIKNTK